MPYLVGFGLLFLGFLLGSLFISWCTRSKIRDLSEEAIHQGARVQDLAEKLRRKNITPSTPLGAVSPSNRCLRLDEEKDLDHALS